MGKIIFCGLILVVVCFGQEEKLNNDSRFAVGLIDGLNYATYLGDDWSTKTVSSPRINIGINSRFKLSTKFSNESELSYLRLFYNTKHNYWDTSFVYEDRITFDNIYLSSEIRMAILRKGRLIPNIGIGLAYVWPFRGTWDSEPLSYENVSNCRSLFLTGAISLELDKSPLDNSVLAFMLDAHYCIVKTSFPHVAHPHFLHTGVAIAESIPLRFTLSLLFKI